MATTTDVSSEEEIRNLLENFTESVGQSKFTRGCRELERIIGKLKLIAKSHVSHELFVTTSVHGYALWKGMKPGDDAITSRKQLSINRSAVRTTALDHALEGLMLLFASFPEESQNPDLRFLNACILESQGKFRLSVDMFTELLLMLHQDDNTEALEEYGGKIVVHIAAILFHILPNDDKLRHSAQVLGYLDSLSSSEVTNGGSDKEEMFLNILALAMKFIYLDFVLASDASKPNKKLQKQAWKQLNQLYNRFRNKGPQSPLEATEFFADIGVLCVDRCEYLLASEFLGFSITCATKSIERHEAGDDYEAPVIGIDITQASSQGITVRMNTTIVALTTILCQIFFIQKENERAEMTAETCLKMMHDDLSLNNGAELIIQDILLQCNPGKWRQELRSTSVERIEAKPLMNAVPTSKEKAKEATGSVRLRQSVVAKEAESESQSVKVAASKTEASQKDKAEPGDKSPQKKKQLSKSWKMKDQRKLLAPDDGEEPTHRPSAVELMADADVGIVGTGLEEEQRKSKQAKDVEDKIIAERNKLRQTAIKAKVSRLQLDMECKRVMFQVQRGKTPFLYDETLRAYSKLMTTKTSTVVVEDDEDDEDDDSFQDSETEQDVK